MEVVAEAREQFTGCCGADRSALIMLALTGPQAGARALCDRTALTVDRHDLAGRAARLTSGSPISERERVPHLQRGQCRTQVDGAISGAGWERMSGRSLISSTDERGGALAEVAAGAVSG